MYLTFDHWVRSKYDIAFENNKNHVSTGNSKKFIVPSKSDATVALF